MATSLPTPEPGIENQQSKIENGGVQVPLRDIERELSQQMRQFQGQEGMPVYRARMSNLVIFCSTQEQAAGVAAQIPDIVAVHPARVLLLVGESGPAKEVTATVLVRPQRLGSLQQCCSEQVTLHAAGACVDQLPFAVRALVIGDLPMNLWWATNLPPPLAGPLVHDLAEYAQQVMYDSLGWMEPARGVAATATWLEQIERGPETGGRWRVASDLNWRRLKYWRRTVSQALSPTSSPRAAESVTELLVEHGPHAVIQAWELVSWLSRRLGWSVRTGKVDPGVEIAWRFEAPQGNVRVRIHRLDQGPPVIRRVRVACRLEGKPAALNLVVENEHRLAIQLEGVEGAPRTITVPPHTPAEIIGRQLSDREPDPVFRESMTVAQVLAQSVLE
jgi:glucose-6-phosphate dehydrogenase assembly protein OpcA